MSKYTDKWRWLATSSFHEKKLFHPIFYTIHIFTTIPICFGLQKYFYCYSLVIRALHFSSSFSEFVITISTKINYSYSDDSTSKFTGNILTLLVIYFWFCYCCVLNYLVFNDWIGNSYCGNWWKPCNNCKTMQVFLCMLKYKIYTCIYFILQHVLFNWIDVCIDYTWLNFCIPKLSTKKNHASAHTHTFIFLKFGKKYHKYGKISVRPTFLFHWFSTAAAAYIKYTMFYTLFIHLYHFCSFTNWNGTKKVKSFEKYYFVYTWPFWLLLIQIIYEMWSADMRRLLISINRGFNVK